MTANVADVAAFVVADVDVVAVAAGVAMGGFEACSNAFVEDLRRRDIFGACMCFWEFGVVVFVKSLEQTEFMKTRRSKLSWTSASTAWQPTTPPSSPQLSSAQAATFTCSCSGRNPQEVVFWVEWNE